METTPAELADYMLRSAAETKDTDQAAVQAQIGHGWAILELARQIALQTKQAGGRPQ